MSSFTIKPMFTSGDGLVLTVRSCSFWKIATCPASSPRRPSTLDARLIPWPWGGQAFPEDAEARQARCRFLFECGDPEEAEQALREQVRREHEDATAYHNLGTVSFRLGRYEAAADRYRQSLRYRPDHRGTCLHLDNALKGIGKNAKASRAMHAIVK
jgi:tetratricopeptide (TPR) repeat protein